ncbi:hypothetical protein IWX47DRAFT_842331 [Phyllosticta citricarpa]
MSVSYAYSSVSTVPAHPLLNDFDLNLLELSPYPCDSCHLDCDNKWENFQQAESSQLSEARYSAHVQDCRSGDKNAQTHLPGAEHDDKSTDTIDGAKKRGDDEVLSRHNGSGCHLKTGDSQNLSRALEQEPESSEDHPLASTRRWHPKSEIQSFRTSLKDSQESLACSTSESKRESESTSGEDHKRQDTNKQRRAVLDNLPGTVWNRICPHLSLDSILRLRMCNRALRRMLSTDSVQPLAKEELEPSSNLPSNNSTPLPKAPQPAPTGGITAGPQRPYYTGYRHYLTSAFPPTPPFYHFEPNRLMHAIDRVVGQSATPSSPLSLRRGGHAMELQIPLSEETLSDSTVPLSPDEEIYTDMWIAAVAPSGDGDNSPEPCPAETAPPDFEDLRYEMGPVMKVPMIRAKL